MLAEVLTENNGTSLVGSSNVIKTATFLEENPVVSVVMMGFSTDPAARWMYPDAHQYLTYFPRFIKAFAGKAFESGNAYYVEGFAGAALWLPPDVHPDEEALIALFEETVADELKKDMFQVFEQMGAYHPDEPHWYLPMIGVDTFQQNKGYGSALMRHALTRCDRENKPAYLESSNPRNISLYSRFGFEVIGTIQAGSSPPIFPMLRKAR
jgi:ribosomal protein S18 acetylase RimI-like enzyme